MDKIKDSKTAMVFFGLLAVATIVMLNLQGCSIDRLVKHPVPPGMQEANGGEAVVSMADSPFVRDRFLAGVESNLSQYDLAAADAAIFAEILNSAVSLGIQELGTSALPGGTLLLGLLGTLGGLYLPKPGTEKRIAQEKEASFNTGMARERDRTVQP